MIDINLSQNHQLIINRKFTPWNVSPNHIETLSALGFSVRLFAEFQKNGSDKFYIVEPLGWGRTAGWQKRWGRSGSAGRSDTASSLYDAVCHFRTKLAKGYVLRTHRTGMLPITVSRMISNGNKIEFFDPHGTKVWVCKPEEAMSVLLSTNNFR